MEGFKYEIGDTVIPKVVLESARMCFKTGTRPSVPDGFHVQIRVLDECIGGVQRHYKLRNWQGVLVEQPEEALMPLMEFYDKWFKLYLQFKEEKNG